MPARGPFSNSQVPNTLTNEKINQVCDNKEQNANHIKVSSTFSDDGFPVFFEYKKNRYEKIFLDDEKYQSLKSSFAMYTTTNKEVDAPKEIIVKRRELSVQSINELEIHKFLNSGYSGEDEDAKKCRSVLSTFLGFHCKDKEYTYIFTEKMEGDLFTFATELGKPTFATEVDQNKNQLTLTPVLTHDIVCKVVQAIYCLHNKKIVHADLRLENVLYCWNANGLSIRLVDYDTAYNIQKNESIEFTQGRNDGYWRSERMEGAAPKYVDDIFPLAHLIRTMLMLANGQNVVDSTKFHEILNRSGNWHEHEIVTLNKFINRCEISNSIADLKRDSHYLTDKKYSRIRVTKLLVQEIRRKLDVDMMITGSVAVKIYTQYEDKANDLDVVILKEHFQWEVSDGQLIIWKNNKKVQAGIYVSTEDKNIARSTDAMKGIPFYLQIENPTILELLENDETFLKVDRKKGVKVDLITSPSPPDYENLSGLKLVTVNDLITQYENNEDEKDYNEKCKALGKSPYRKENSHPKSEEKESEEEDSNS